MESLLIVQSSKARVNEAIELNSAKFPNLKHCWHARTKSEGIRMIRKHKPALVILDVNMERGLDFELFESTKDVPYRKIIICDTDGYVFKVLRFDIDQYLLKPAGNAEIEDAIEKLLFQRKRYRIQQLYDTRNSIKTATLTMALVRTLDGHRLIDLASVIRVQRHDDLLQLHLEGGVMVHSPWTMQRLVARFVGNGFLRVDADQLISCAYIQQLDDKGERLFAEMQDGHKVLVPTAMEERIHKRFPRGRSKPLEEYPLGGSQ
jgi:two-component system LytT family response regulator